MKHKSPTLDDLSLFCKVVQTLANGHDKTSLREISHQLKIPVPKLSKLLSRLEEYYQHALLVREQGKRLGKESLTELGRKVFRETKKYLREVRSPEKPSRGSLSELKEELSEFRHEYHISCEFEQVTPEWRTSAVTLRPGIEDGHFTGTLSDSRFQETDARQIETAEFKIIGRLYPRLFTFTAFQSTEMLRKTGMQREAFVATFMRITPASELLGVWSGEDWNGVPISGTIVLSKEEMTLQQLIGIADSWSIRFYQSAQSVSKHFNI